MIWKAPWGNHIDLDKIVDVYYDEGSPDNHMSPPTLMIHFQLMDNPVHVVCRWRKHKITDQGQEVELVKSWHQQLISAWKKHKNQPE